MSKATNVVWSEGVVTRNQRWTRFNMRGGTLWFTGLSASGKSTISAELEKVLIEGGVHAYRLDGDNIRHGLNRNLGFSAEDRAENIRRIGEVARLFADSGCLALTAFISPYRADRDAARRIHQESDLPFFEVFVEAPIAVCEERDPKGMYKKARAGQIKGFTGVDDPYESPLKPELVLETHKMTVEQSVKACLNMLIEHGLVPRT